MEGERIKEILRESFFAYFCSVDDQDQPHITPMFFVFDDETCTMYFVTRHDTKKVDNIRKRPYVSITVDFRDPSNPLNNEGVMLQGKVDVMLPAQTWEAGKNEMEFMYKLFQEKYPKIVLEQIDAFLSPEILIKITPEKITHWKGSNFSTIYPGR
ncbi:hypothetical protein AKJ63_01465 [candidate division MSBL1 archaeon SCGC-AAA259D18]|uniref:Pyridoxamine 5'-phosphate oxidase N-terminal domain-containing protein n=1 Tax=candidate division MSBL1 archaeon SCGC-AAA259D18 TaxID=1698262 RepID=A0A133UB96_9EURY|nr:hypothetical protein AKJ63_01465 [candidate division MSBL1 archaeon SCGC-AAA259D18]